MTAGNEDTGELPGAFVFRIIYWFQFASALFSKLLILQQSEYEIVVGVVDLLRVITTVPLLLSQPPEGSTAVLWLIVNDPVFPPEMENEELALGAPRVSRQDWLEFMR